ncbi:MAG: hypothetical protein P8X39_04345 [Desulfofustis sp.]|jgi:hypothetical protein
MQNAIQRPVILYTPNKIYAGNIDLKNDEIRTIDQLNSSTIYWKNPAEKSFNDAILLYDVEVSVHGADKFTSFKKLQLRLSDIIFFTDQLQSSGDSSEKLRAQTLSAKAKDERAQAKIITEMRGDSFFFIFGTFHGLFKNKTKQRFFPLTDVKAYEILRTGGKWERIEINLSNQFIGLSSNHIESCSLSAYE